MTRADRVHSTPPTNTPVNPTRRRFFAIAAVGSIVGAGSLAAAVMASPDIPAAVTAPSGNPSPALRAAIRQLAGMHEALIRAQADSDEAEGIWLDWVVQNPQPKSKRGIRKWIKRAGAYHDSVATRSWRALIDAESAFAKAQDDVAEAPIASNADLHTMVACSVMYDRVELARHNRAPLAVRVAGELFRTSVADQLFRQGKAVLS
jgi:hypothetical protein